MIDMFNRQELVARVCALLKREYVALLGQRGSGIQTFINTLVNERPPVSGMKFISITLPEGKWSEDTFNELFLERLKTVISDVPPEGILSNQVLQEIGRFNQYPADFRLRIALDTLGKATTASPLVIVLQSLAQAPEESLRNLLLMLRDYHRQRNMQNQPGNKIRFLAAGDIRLWLLCCQGTNDKSPFNIAKRLFLDGLSCRELAALDRSGDIEAAMHMRNLTNGIPSLVQKAVELSHIPDDLSPFFGLLENYWNSLSEASKQALKRFAEDSSSAPKCIPDYECPQIPRVESPWMEAFWKGFLRVHQRELTWHSPIHRAFVMNRMQVQGDTSKPVLERVDLLERSLRLEKALKRMSNDESRSEYLEEALSLSVQTHGTILAPVLKMIWSGEERTIILEKVNQIAAGSNKGWIKELAEKATGNKESIASLLIDAAMWEPRRLLGDFDVFLSYNSQDGVVVKGIAEQLLERGILPWFDMWELRPGLPWQRLLEQQIERVKSALVFVGEDGIGPWQRQEFDALLREFVNKGCPVIPVLLPSVPNEPQLPIFLKGMTWIDFRKQGPEPMERLIWGITGKRSSQR